MEFYLQYFIYIKILVGFSLCFIAYKLYQKEYKKISGILVLLIVVLAFFRPLKIQQYDDKDLSRYQAVEVVSDLPAKVVDESFRNRVNSPKGITKKDLMEEGIRQK